LLTLLAASLFSIGAQASAATEKDLEAAMRALSYTGNPPAGTVRMGIVFQPGSERSRNEATETAKLLGTGMQIGSVTVVPVLLKLTELDHASVDMVLLTQGVGAEAQDLAKTMTVRKLPCFTVDLSQVKNGACMMGIQSEPQVVITVNRAAAADSGISFSTIFRMFIKEI
jgi:hypothetical protein